jgi:hypothetical protein
MFHWVVGTVWWEHCGDITKYIFAKTPKLFSCVDDYTMFLLGCKKNIYLMLQECSQNIVLMVFNSCKNFPRTHFFMFFQIS